MRYRFIDRVSDFRPNEYFRGLKVVSFEEYDLKSSLGQASLFPPVLLTECLFQAAYWLEVLSSDFKNCALFSSFDKLCITDSIRPGSRASIEINVFNREKDFLYFNGAVTQNSIEIASISNACAEIRNLADYDDPDDLKTLFSEIQKNA
ncbi:MAG: hypothetical protein HQM10_11735 [Candidatus Riflebacteria bacterium]|nr:hypothetical protein [Candidatus Riflebacteria bacterium]